MAEVANTQEMNCLMLVGMSRARFLLSYFGMVVGCQLVEEKSSSANRLLHTLVSAFSSAGVVCVAVCVTFRPCPRANSRFLANSNMSSISSTWLDNSPPWSIQCLSRLYTPCV